MASQHQQQQNIQQQQRERERRMIWSRLPSLRRGHGRLTDVSRRPDLILSRDQILPWPNFINNVRNHTRTVWGDVPNPFIPDVGMEYYLVGNEISVSSRFIERVLQSLGGVCARYHLNFGDIQSADGDEKYCEPGSFPDSTIQGEMAKNVQ